jgi:hypothetical protein
MIELLRCPSNDVEASTQFKPFHRDLRPRETIGLQDISNQGLNALIVRPRERARSDLPVIRRPKKSPKRLAYGREVIKIMEGPQVSPTRFRAQRGQRGSRLACVRLRLPLAVST